MTTLPETLSPGETVVSLMEIASICGGESGGVRGARFAMGGAVAAGTEAPGVGVMTGGVTSTGEGVGVGAITRAG
ncbi:MAG TPA: hypothetical protein VFE35_02435 [Candidatus Cybelea sp.]|nr:hypothetical protein [Candidatus Cybelea sp.]